MEPPFSSRNNPFFSKPPPSKHSPYPSPSPEPFLKSTELRKDSDVLRQAQ